MFALQLTATSLHAGSLRYCLIYNPEGKDTHNRYYRLAMRRNDTDSWSHIFEPEKIAAQLRRAQKYDLHECKDANCTRVPERGIELYADRALKTIEQARERYAMIWAELQAAVKSAIEREIDPQEDLTCRVLNNRLSWLKQHWGSKQESVA